MISWQCKSFYELSLRELYDILQLREQVFQIEQHCLYRDIDGIDFCSQHLMGYQNNQLFAYLRLFEENDFVLFGRVVVTKSMRGQGLGKALVNQCLQYIHQHYTNQRIKISAQFHLKKFYEQFGFKSIGECYEEDGIAHITMIKD